MDRVLSTIEALPAQCKDAYEEASKVKFDEGREIKNIVMVGMGGSGLAARIIESVYVEDLSLPLVRVNDYHLPGFVDENTLVVVSSYSGNTEEVLEATKTAVAKRAVIMGVGTGGELEKLAKTHDFPFYKIDPKHNPSKQPRMAIGYSVVGQMVLASKAGLFNFEKEKLMVALEAMKAAQKKAEVAEGVASRMKGKVVLFIGSHHTSGALHTVNNQFNENAKVLTADYSIPELNHHLMEGLKHPKSNKDSVFVFMADSDLYTDKIQRRFEVTKEVIRKQDIEVYSYKLTAPTRLSQAFELVQFGSYLGYFLAKKYGQDPIPIPWVDYFKQQLG